MHSTRKLCAVTAACMLACCVWSARNDADAGNAWLIRMGELQLRRALHALHRVPWAVQMHACLQMQVQRTRTCSRGSYQYSVYNCSYPASRSAVSCKHLRLVCRPACSPSVNSSGRGTCATDHHPTLPCQMHHLCHPGSYLDTVLCHSLFPAQLGGSLVVLPW
jgi:hypothetical protein